MDYYVQVDEKGIPSTDVGFKLIEACKYQNWYNGKEEHSIKLVHNVENSNNKIYVGSIDFVEKALGKMIKPINIPTELNDFEFLHRKIFYGQKSDLRDFMKSNKVSSVFVKSNEKCKAFNSMIIDINEIESYLNDDYDYMFSTTIDNIQAEWRVFVHNNMIRDAKIYMGEWQDNKYIPADFIKKSILTYKNSPKSYTIDIGVTENKEPFIIEVHNFVSCGLYGFDDYKILPQMVYNGYMHEKQKGGK